MAHRQLEEWVESVAAVTLPQRVHWCDGSQDEIDRLYEAMTAEGSLTPLDPRKHPRSYYARSDANDVARVEDRTFICSSSPDDAGPTNNWKSPDEMHALVDPLFDGSMRGRTLYVIPYLMGPANSPLARAGVQLTDSPYVVANMRIMTRMGSAALDHLDAHGRFVRGLHGIGSLDPEQRYICHFPDEDLILSFSSNYGGNALLAKKCHALRLASVQARREGWMAEHMLIMGITDPRGRTIYVAGAFPSACGKSNLAMLIPPEADRKAGWKIETIGDDIAWMHFGDDGRLHAINPEFGFFAVAPGTNHKTNPNMMQCCRSDTLFTNVALRPDGTVWWEGHDDPPPPRALDWKGRPWTPESYTLAAHPNSRFTAPLAQCPCLSPQWNNPAGVPISAILFGARRLTTAPLVVESFDWNYGTYSGASLASERTAAAAGTVGQLRQDPMAMLPFCGYHMADYWQHWLNMGARGGAAMPRVFNVNWFRKGSDGRWLWPGYSENMRVLKWIFGRVLDDAPAVETPLGYMPSPGALDLPSLELSDEARAQLFTLDPEQWRIEMARREKFFESFGERLPAEIRAQHGALKKRLTAAAG